MTLFKYSLIRAFFIRCCSVKKIAAEYNEKNEKNTPINDKMPKKHMTPSKNDHFMLSISCSTLTSELIF